VTDDKDIAKLDIYADENEPKSYSIGVIRQYRVEIPNQHYNFYAVLSVREDNYAEIDGFKFDGVTGPVTESFAQTQEVWSWLQEWDYVVLKPIGPEDSEYFATDKLTNSKPYEERGELSE